MTKKIPEGAERSAFTFEFDGERVPESMGMTPLVDSGSAGKGASVSPIRTPVR